MMEEKYDAKNNGNVLLDDMNNNNNNNNIGLNNDEENDLDPNEANQMYLEANKYSDEAKKIRDSSWKQMKCKTTSLKYNVNWVKCIYICIAVICLPIGVFTYNLSQSVSMQVFPPYDKNENCSLRNKSDYGRQCIVRYKIDHDFDPPIYFHYKLTKFYQNHRSYVKSRTEDQLNGVNALDVSTCDPRQYYNGLALLPCGLIAYSFFNDKYFVTYFSNNNVLPNQTFNNDTGGIELCPSSLSTCNKNEHINTWTDASWYDNGPHKNWDKSAIAWDSDRNGPKFKKTHQVRGKTTNQGQLQIDQNVTLPNTDDQDFIVWMRTATNHQFTKLHRVIHNQSFKKGDEIQVLIKNYFDVSEFGGSKSIVITTNNALGGKNDVLGIGFMVIGSLSLLTAICFWVFIPPSSAGVRPIATELQIAVSMH